jgi:sulfate transport system ATP-binding protein
MSIELRSVTKRFGEVAAVDNISLKVADGELVALLGPSGGGKTTVLRIIAGLETPTDGEIFIADRKVNDLPVQQRNIGFVFQGYALFRTMTVYDNIAFGLKIRGSSRKAIAARVEELTKIFSLDGLAKRFPHQLSGGQRQRVAIARALASKPRVLLMDEPFAAVDAKVRSELREWLVRLHDELNVTTVFVTHDQEEAMEISNRIVIFSKGKLEQIGSPRDVYESPRTEFVARFIGVLNVLELRVRNSAAEYGELQFPSHGVPEGETLRIGFRPYAVQVSPSPTEYAYQGVLKHVYFLGVMLRLELLTASGLSIRTRMTKEDFARLKLKEGQNISFRIKEYRILSKEDGALGAPITVRAEKPAFADDI